LLRAAVVFEVTVATTVASSSAVNVVPFICLTSSPRVAAAIAASVVAVPELAIASSG